MDSKSTNSGSASELGLTEKSKITESEDALGMGTVGPNQGNMKGNKPAPNPSVSAPRGHTIK